MNGTQQTIVWLAVIAAALTLILTGNGAWIAAPIGMFFIWCMIQ